ncbi:SPARC-like [Acanthaster planci]|uniref:SPARC-like n=1 Tax=Acanthaster planci TaxID=133434 RepID=A0A8B7Y537_ACAPL|nr:SPARC-like [Acanthaster planci]
MAFSRVVILLCIVAVALASKHKTKHQQIKAARHEIRNAKKALESLTYTKEEQIYSIDGYQEENEESVNDVSDKCHTLQCPPGETCYVDGNGAPYCDCVELCPEEENDPFIQVCSTTNVTYRSQCELYRLRCANPTEMDVEQLDYFGPCKIMEQCNPADLVMFPERMRTWFFEVMKELSGWAEQEGGLDEEERRVEKEAEAETKPWRRPLHWKFFNMDIAPNDFHLSTAELKPMRAQLLPMEPCTDAFIASCDTNDDDLISIVEWGKCMGLNDDEILY